MPAFKVAMRAGAALLVLGLLGLLVWDVAHPTSGTKIAGEVARRSDPPAPAFRANLIWNDRGTWPSNLRSVTTSKTLSLSSLRGHVVVLNFWASWCEGCKSEEREIAAAAERLRGQAVFLGVDSQDLRSPGREFLKKYGVHFPSVSDGSAAITTGKYGIPAIPETYIVSPRGRLVDHIVGPTTVAVLRAAVAAAA